MPRGWQLDTELPVNRDHPLCRGLKLWLLCLPHLSAGGKLRDLMGTYAATGTNLGAGDGFAGAVGTPLNSRFGLQAATAYGAVSDDTAHPMWDRSKSFTLLGSYYCVGNVNDSSLHTIISAQDASHSQATTGQLAYRDGITGDQIYFNLWTTNYKSGASAVAPNTGTGSIHSRWVRAAGRANATTNLLDAFYDGGNKGTGVSYTGSESSFPANRCEIGRLAYNNNSYLKGLLDDVKVYTRALSDREVFDENVESVTGYPEALRWYRSRATWLYQAPTAGTTFTYTGNITITNTPAVADALRYAQAVNVTITNTPLITEVVNYVRSLSVSITNSVTVTRLHQLIKAISISNTVAVTKKILKNLSVTITNSSSITKLISLNKAVTITNTPSVIAGIRYAHSIIAVIITNTATAAQYLFLPGIGAQLGKRLWRHIAIFLGLRG